MSDTGFLAECAEHSARPRGWAGLMRKTDAELAGVGGVLRTQKGGGRPGGMNAEQNSVLCLEQSQLGPAGGHFESRQCSVGTLMCGSEWC